MKLIQGMEEIVQNVIVGIGVFFGNLVVNIFK